MFIAFLGGSLWCRPPLILPRCARMFPTMCTLWLELSAPDCCISHIRSLRYPFYRRHSPCHHLPMSGFFADAMQVMDLDDASPAPSSPMSSVCSALTDTTRDEDWQASGEPMIELTRPDIPPSRVQGWQVSVAEETNCATPPVHEQSRVPVRISLTPFENESWMHEMMGFDFAAIVDTVHAHDQPVQQLSLADNASDQAPRSTSTMGDEALFSYKIPAQNEAQVEDAHATAPGFDGRANAKVSEAHQSSTPTRLTETEGAGVLAVANSLPDDKPFDTEIWPQRTVRDWCDGVLLFTQCQSAESTDGAGQWKLRKNPDRADPAETFRVLYSKGDYESMYPTASGNHPYDHIILAMEQRRKHLLEIGALAENLDKTVTYQDTDLWQYRRREDSQSQQGSDRPLRLLDQPFNTGTVIRLCRSLPSPVTGVDGQTPGAPYVKKCAFHKGLLGSKRSCSSWCSEEPKSIYEMSISHAPGTKLRPRLNWAPIPKLCSREQFPEDCLGGSLSYQEAQKGLKERWRSVKEKRAELIRESQGYTNILTPHDVVMHMRGHPCPCSR